MTLFGGEHVELLIAPFGLNEDGIYYHFALNPAGSVYHAKRHDTEWNLDNVCKTEKPLGKSNPPETLLNQSKNSFTLNFIYCMNQSKTNW